eukprot:scaffold11887_cov38-Tisochrysis_lutea.AAC.1
MAGSVAARGCGETERGKSEACRGQSELSRGRSETGRGRPGRDDASAPPPGPAQPAGTSRSSQFTDDTRLLLVL